ncbi:MAG: extracellular solute-binding protein [Chloroflexi bacterium]|nr:extracellular solute-binding protein [Chloroflexota bacterium]
MTHKPRKTQLTRRDFLKLAGATGAGLAASNWLAACAAPTPTAAPTPEVYTGEVFDSGGATLNIGIWGSVWTDFERENLLNQFEKDFNCKVQVDNGPQWFPKLVAAGVDNPPFDLINQNLPEATQGADAGFYVPVDEVKANVPNSADLWDFAFKGTGLIRAWSGLGLSYRTDLASKAPESWADLWNDEFDGKRGILTPLNNSFTASLFMVASKIFGSGYEDTEAGLKAMEGLVPCKLGDLSPTLDNWLGAGEIIIANEYDGSAWGMAANGASVAWVAPKEGVPILEQNVSITKGSKQKNLAYALLNRMVSAEYQAKLCDFFMMRPTNKNTQLSDKMKAVGMANDAEAVKNVWIPDWKWWNSVQAELSEKFDKIMQAG